MKPSVPIGIRQQSCRAMPLSMMARLPARYQHGAVQNGMIAIIVVVLIIGLAAYWQKNQSAKARQAKLMADASAPIEAPILEQQPTDTAVEMLPMLYPARLNLVTGAQGELLGCTGIIGDATLKYQLIQQISGVFIEQYQPCQIDLDPAYQPTLMDINAVTRLAQIIQGRPHVMIAINNHHWLPADTVVGMRGSIVVNAPSAEELSKIQIAIREQTGNAFSLDVLPVFNEQQEVQRSVATARYMLRNLPNPTRPADLAAALNAQMIQFDFDQAVIPTWNQPVLYAGVAVLNLMPELHVEIRGFTDAVGSREYNQQISTLRAEAVRDYLIAQGLSADRVSAVGLGQQQPIADNATEQGQFRNRRIEFRLFVPLESASPAVSDVPSVS
ncbi:MAG: OmpA family protein [Pseudomonadota bacterium]|nr:OmpA family protein [Pseudomonadota bacterium]